MLLSTFTVSNTDDFGPGSLRQAIFDTNADTESRAIVFDIPGSDVHLITPSTNLPSIKNTVVIDGYSQVGSSPNTLAQGDTRSRRS